MTTATVSVKTDPDAARYYREASAQDRSKLGVLWAVLIRLYRANPVSLRRILGQIGLQAERRGLTPAKLESILNADS